MMYAICQTLEKKIAAYDKVFTAYAKAKAQIRHVADLCLGVTAYEDAKAQIRSLRPSDARATPRHRSATYKDAKAISEALGCGSYASAALIAALQVVQNF
jgi:23S rRNA maturation mini-RNase III